MELVSRVKALLRRTGEQDVEKVIKIGDLVIDDEKRKVFVSGSAVELTYKEYELLHYLAQNQEIVLPRDSIMEHICMQTVRLNRARSMCISRHCVISLEMQENILKPYGMSGTA